MSEETETPKPADVAGRLDGLVGRLRSLARAEHDDLSVADEAADELELIDKYLLAMRAHLELSEAPFYEAMLILRQALLPPIPPNDLMSRPATK